MTEPQNRRRFFAPGSILRAGGLDQVVGDLIDKLDEVANEPVVTLRREAMACLFEIQFGALEMDRRPAFAALDLIDDLESQLSIYREDSELSAINRKAFAAPVPVEERLFDLLVRCDQLRSSARGAFDITAGPLIKAWGFFRRQGRVPTDEELRETLGRVGGEHVALDRAARTVRFGREGMEINLAAIGKGYALDRAAERLQQSKFPHALLSAGHSSLRTVGSPPWDDAWQVDLASPLNRNVSLGSVRLKDVGFSTSGSSEQFFIHEGKRYGHVIDPRTGRPATGILQASVVAPDAATAEALSTAFFILGVEWARGYCRAHPGVGAILVPDSGPEAVATPLGAIAFSPARTGT